MDGYNGWINFLINIIVIQEVYHQIYFELYFLLSFLFYLDIILKSLHSFFRFQNKFLIFVYLLIFNFYPPRLKFIDPLLPSRLKAARNIPAVDKEVSCLSVSITKLLQPTSLK